MLPPLAINIKAKIKTNTAYYFQRDFNSTHSAVLFCIDEVTARAAFVEQTN